jgi:hypothetical protein
LLKFDEFRAVWERPGANEGLAPIRPLWQKNTMQPRRTLNVRSHAFGSHSMTSI